MEAQQRTAGPLQKPRYSFGLVTPIGPDDRENDEDRPQAALGDDAQIHLISTTSDQEEVAEE